MLLEVVSFLIPRRVRRCRLRTGSAREMRKPLACIEFEPVITSAPRGCDIARAIDHHRAHPELGQADGCGDAGLPRADDNYRFLIHGSPVSAFGGVNHSGGEPIQSSGCATPAASGLSARVIRSGVCGTRCADATR